MKESSPGLSINEELQSQQQLMRNSQPPEIH